MKQIILSLIIVLVFCRCEEKASRTKNRLDTISNNAGKTDSLINSRKNGKKDFEIKLVDGKKSGIGYLYNDDEDE